VPRSGHTATLLLAGKLLVTGGGNGVADATAELYDPATETFTLTVGNMTEPRIGHTATLLNLGASSPNNGKVLILGPADPSAELYDPSTSTFTKTTGSMNHARTSPTATLLNTGKVLIAGGNTATGDLTAELYDPATETFSDTGSTAVLHSGPTATLLSNGQVLIAGGGTNSAELYDPNSGTFSATAGPMTMPRSGHTATLLADGDVLIIGTDGTTELFDHSKETFAAVGSFFPYPILGIYKHTATLRNDGTVLAAGGYHPFISERCPRNGLDSSPAASMFAPESEGFTITGALNTPRDAHTATVLNDGTVLVVGGTTLRFIVPTVCTQSSAVQSSAELFQTQ
jgi:WD40 repeat protein